MHPAMHLIHRGFTAAGASTLDQSDRVGLAGLCCETILERSRRLSVWSFTAYMRLRNMPVSESGTLVGIPVACMPRPQLRN